MSGRPGDGHPDGPRDRPRPVAGRTTQALLVVAAVAVALAVKVNGGSYHPVGVALLGVAAAAGLAAVAGVRFAALETRRWEPTYLVLAAAAVLMAASQVGRFVPPSTGPDSPVQMYPLLRDCGIDPPADGPIPDTAARVLFVAAGVVGLAGAFAAVRGRRGVAVAAAMPVALVLHLSAQVAAVRAAPAPAIDVLVFQSVGVAHLMGAADNPYAATFPDVAGDAVGHYPPELVVERQLMFGFPYPPLTLAALVPCYLAGVVVQHAHAVGFTLAAALIAYAGRGRAGRAAGGAAAVLFMATPTGPLVVCYGWTEALVAPMLALTVFAACRLRGQGSSDEVGSGGESRASKETGAFVAAGGSPRVLSADTRAPARGYQSSVGHLSGSARWTAVALGLFWAAKQYVPLTAPLAWLLTDDPAAANATGTPTTRASRQWRPGRLWAVAVGTAAAVSLPLALWDLPAFWHSAVAVQFRQPFRPDALSFAAAAYQWLGAAPPAWAAFVVLAAVQALALWRSPRTPAGFAAATGTALLLFFACGKQAFAGYYFLVSAAYACALAVGSTEGGADRVSERSPEGAPHAAGGRDDRRRRTARNPHAGV